MKNKNIIITYLLLFTVFVSCTKEGSNDANFGGGNTGVGGSTARFTIVGNYLYTVDNQNLNVFSIANGANPTKVNTVNIGFAIETIYPFKDKLFIGSTTAVYIYSITNPESPQRLGTAISPTVIRRCDPVVARDTVAYATLRANGSCGGTQSILAVYDVKDPTNPIQKTFRNIIEPYGLGFADNTLYVCDRTSLKVYDITVAYNPIEMSTIVGAGTWFKDVIPMGNTLICWVSDGLMLYNITNRNNPTLIKKII